MQAEAIAREVLHALDSCEQIAPFSDRCSDFSIQHAYRVSAALRRLRSKRGERPAGRKIGFTNRNIWPEFNVDAPIWGDMYELTIRKLTQNDRFDLERVCEPLIEPEIALHLAHPPDPTMQERELFSCVDWIALGFEIVQSIYPGWKFRAADAIANGGMHQAFLVGEPQAVTARNRDELFRSLPTALLVLRCDGHLMDEGRGENVLGGPLSALRHLVGLLADDPDNPPLASGEIVTTGTITRALPVKPGETWSAEISGLPLAEVRLRFV